jgi:hypothetical protein
MPSLDFYWIQDIQPRDALALRTASFGWEANTCCRPIANLSPQGLRRCLGPISAPVPLTDAMTPD